MRKDITLKPEELKNADPMNTQRIFILLVFLITSCTPTIQDVMPSNTPIMMEATPTFTPELTQTPIPPTSTPTLINTLCSPLENESVPELVEIITQPFKMPRSGNDDGHHGIDFFHYQRKDRLSIEGLGVQSILPGTVVTILNDRQPYGIAIIIETPLNEIDSMLLSQVPELQPEPTVAPDPRVNCPPGELNFVLDEKERSLYTLYAHLQFLPNLSIGDQVVCGQQIGMVGNTGISSGPHLHLETRIGPSGAKFESMAYSYATFDEIGSERYNYCVWRVSNLFQLFDPMLLLSTQE